jgi:hypothetical protein
MLFNTVSTASRHILHRSPLWSEVRQTRIRQRHPGEIETRDIASAETFHGWLPTRPRACDRVLDLPDCWPRLGIAYPWGQRPRRSRCVPHAVLPGDCPCTPDARLSPSAPQIGISRPGSSWHRPAQYPGRSLSRLVDSSDHLLPGPTE